MSCACLLLQPVKRCATAILLEAWFVVQRMGKFELRDTHRIFGRLASFAGVLAKGRTFIQQLATNGILYYTQVHQTTSSTPSTITIMRQLSKSVQAIART